VWLPPSSISSSPYPFAIPSPEPFKRAGRGVSTAKIEVSGAAYRQGAAKPFAV
jgi:hypothetical protein